MRDSERCCPGHDLYGLNYSFDRVRLMARVLVGKRIRCHSRLLDVESRGQGRYLVKSEYRIEVEGVDKPAMITEWLFLLVYPTEAIPGAAISPQPHVS